MLLIHRQLLTISSEQDTNVMSCVILYCYINARAVYCLDHQVCLKSMLTGYFSNISTFIFNPISVKRHRIWDITCVVIDMSYNLGCYVMETILAEN